MTERLEKMPSAQYTRLREALEELARRHLSNNLTVRQAARTLRLTQGEILQLIDNSECLALITAYQAGSGISVIERKGDYLIEYT